jgi:hypothetical protein
LDGDGILIIRCGALAFNDEISNCEFVDVLEDKDWTPALYIRRYKIRIEERMDAERMDAERFLETYGGDLRATTRDEYLVEKRKIQGSGHPSGYGKEIGGSHGYFKMVMMPENAGYDLTKDLINSDFGMMDDGQKEVVRERYYDASTHKSARHTRGAKKHSRGGPSIFTTKPKIHPQFKSKAPKTVIMPHRVDPGGSMQVERVVHPYKRYDFSDLDLSEEEYGKEKKDDLDGIIKSMISTTGYYGFENPELSEETSKEIQAILNWGGEMKIDPDFVKDPFALLPGGVDDGL